MDIQACRAKLREVDESELEAQTKQVKSLLQTSMLEAEELDLWADHDCRQFAVNTCLPLQHQPAWTSIDGFRNRITIAEGRSGDVFRAEYADSAPPQPRFVALKQFQTTEAEPDLLGKYSIRELTLHCSLFSNTPNILRTYGIVGGPNCVYLALEYMPISLADLLDRCADEGKRFTEHEIQNLLGQILRGLEAIHARHVVHRDLNPSNILVDATQTVKISDFGDARQRISNSRPMTQSVGTIWYRAPEMCLLSDSYDEKVDMWAAGCILAEMVLLEPLLQGTGDLQQIQLIGTLIGKPSPAYVDFYSHFGYEILDWQDTRAYQAILPEGTLSIRLQKTSPGIREFIRGLLRWNPSDRPAASRALNEFARSVSYHDDHRHSLVPIDLFAGSERADRKTALREAEVTSCRLVLQEMVVEHCRGDCGTDSEEYRTAVNELDSLKRKRAT